MRKSIKSFIALLVIIFGVLQMSTLAFAAPNIPTATSDFYVNDFAGVFSPDEKSRLMDNAITLSDEHDGIQVVVSTVTSLDGNTIESYALEMYNQYGIGKNDMGILILLSTGDRKIRIEVGKAMEAYINDGKAGAFIDDYAIPSLKENKFDEGLINLQEALIAEIVNITDAENSQSALASTQKTHFNFLNFLGIFILICISVAIVSFIIIAFCKLIAKSQEKQNTIEDLSRKLELSKQNQTLLERKISDLKADKSQLSSDYQNLQNKYKILEDRYNRVQILYPNADTDVSKMIEDEIRQKDIDTARQIDSCIQSVLVLSASKDIFPEVKNALVRYQALTDAQKSYVKSDIDKLNQLYNESLELKQVYDKMLEEEKNKKLAVAAASSIAAIISCISIGKAQDFRKLKEAKSVYDNLSPNARPYFDKSIVTKLDKLLNEAKRDKEEEDERRRRMQSSSSSSLGGSSHFGGFGGHSGGGGASRGF